MAAAAAAWVLPEEPEEQSAPQAEAGRELHTQEKRRDRESRVGRAEGAAFVYDGVAAGRAVRAGLSRRSAGGRPLPMEGVAFFSKGIDNSGLRRNADPAARSGWTRMIATGAVLLLIAIACFGPRAWLRHSGYREAALIEQRDELMKTQRQLLVSHEQLTDSRRVEQMAAAQGLEAPGPERVAWQDLTIDPVGGERALAQSFLEAR